MDLIKLTLVFLAGWMNRQNQDVIDYLQEKSGSWRNSGKGNDCDSWTSSVLVWRERPRRSGSGG